ncbi:MAG: hypothetical protein AAB706_01755 [Patescibacteria group bacterium]
MKKIVILKHGGGELANQLWNYMSVYAYSLLIGVEIKNPSFFEYHSFFRFLPQEDLLTKWFSFFFRTIRRRAHIVNRLARLKYSLISKLIAKTHTHCVLSSENKKNEVFYLPPTQNLLEPSNLCDTIYFLGWLWRNPIGLKKFRNELIKVFTPIEEIEIKVNAIISSLRQKNEKVIGIHIRQADYKTFKGGKYFIDQKRIRDIVHEYMIEKKMTADKTSFLITSDGPINESAFKDLNIYISKENSVTDLFILSKTDCILGSDSSFGAFASWYGDVPHIIFKNEAIDWDYYEDKVAFFENKYSSVVHY